MSKVGIITLTLIIILLNVGMPVSALAILKGKPDDDLIPVANPQGWRQANQLIDAKNSALELVAVGAQKQLEPSKIKSLIKDLGNIKADGKAMDSLTKIGAPAVESLIAVLNNKQNNQLTRVNAIRVLGRIGDKRAVGPLIQALISQEDVRWFTTEALGMIGDKKAVIPLISVLRDEINKLASAREKLDDFVSVNFIAHHHRQQAKQTAEALGKLGDQRAVEPLIDALLKSDDSQIGTSAAKALGKIGDKRAVEPLLQFFQQHDWYAVRYTVTVALGEIDGGENMPVDYFIKYLKENPNEKTRGLLDLFERAKKLNIEFPTRFNQDTLSEIVQNREKSKPDGRPLAVVIYPKSDWNDAFYNTDEIDNLIDHGYRVMYYEAKTDGESIRILKDSTKYQKASIILLGGHGTRESLSLGGYSSEKDQLDINDVKQLKRSRVSTSLEKGGQIILYSCSTGKGKERLDNLANSLREIFPQASRIWAPTDITYDVDFRFEGNKLIDVKFHSKSTYRAEGGGR